MINRNFLLTICCILLSIGCATNPNLLAPKTEIFDIPPINTVQTAELGDTVVSKGKITTFDAIQLQNEISAGDGVFIKKFTIPPQNLVAKNEDKKWTYYNAQNMTSYDAILGTSPVYGGLKISKEKKKNQFEERIYGGNYSVSLKPKQDPIYEFIIVEDFNQPGFKQELIYNGRVDNHVKFLYRELSNNMMRAPFTQEVQYDLNDGNTIGFKGVRIEIIEATNTTLKYKVLNSFPESQ